MNDLGYDKFSIAVVKICSEKDFDFNLKSDLAYFVLEGEGKFLVGEEEFVVKKGDLVFIPKNTKYKDCGELMLLAVFSSRFGAD